MCNPLCPTELFDVRFLPVSEPGAGSAASETFLVAILFGRPCPSDAVVYATSNREVYVRRRVGFPGCMVLGFRADCLQTVDWLGFITMHMHAGLDSFTQGLGNS